MNINDVEKVEISSILTYQERMQVHQTDYLNRCYENRIKAVVYTILMSFSDMFYGSCVYAFQYEENKVEWKKPVIWIPTLVLSFATITSIIYLALTIFKVFKIKNTTRNSEYLILK